MAKQTAERAGAEHAEDSQRGPTINAIPLYGSGNGSWRERNARIYPSDPSLRWAVDQHRDELIEQGALGLFGGRLFAVEPTFSAMMVAYAQEAIGFRAAERQRAAQAAADAAVAARVNAAVARIDA
jgi:hypothetical protein